MLEPGAAVQVLFPETGRSFPGTIRQARGSEDNDELMFDVEYAEPVNGKYVVDQCVPASRVTAMDETERKAFARQKKDWAQEVRKASSGSLGAGGKRIGSKADDTMNQDDTASVSMSVAPSDITAYTTLSSASARPRRASAAAAKANMLVGDEVDEILDDMEQAERVEAGEKAKGVGSSISNSSSSTKQRAVRGAGKVTALQETEGTLLPPSEQMFEKDVTVEELDGGQGGLPLSGLTAKDFISRILKKVEGASSSTMRPATSSSRMETGGDVFDSGEAEEEEEQGCVLTPQEVVQLNEVLSAKQVHIMLQAVHAKAAGKSSGGSGAKKQKRKERVDAKQEKSNVEAASALISPESEAAKGEVPEGHRETPSDVASHAPSAMDAQEGHSKNKDGGDEEEEEEEEEEEGAFSVNAKTGENPCRMLTAQLCAFITHDSEVRADIQKAYLEALPEPKEPVVDSDDDDIAASFLMGKGRGGKGRGRAAKRKKVSEGELVLSTAEYHPVQWLRAQNRGGQLLLRSRALLGAAASLLRILAISSLMSSVEVTVGADKTVEKALCCVTDFVKANFGSLSWRHKLGVNSRAYSRMEEQLVMVVIRTTGFACLPLIRSVMGATQCLLASRTQSTAITTASIRLAFAAMEADPHCSLNAACLEFSPAARGGSKRASTSAASQVHAQVASAAAASASNPSSLEQRAKEDAALVARGSQMSPLLALHASARSLLTCLGQHYPGTRARIVEDVIQLLSAVYVGDQETSHRKLHGQYQVHHSAPPAASTAAHALGFSGNPRFVTDALALLLCFVQAAGMPEGGLAVGDSMRRRAGPREGFVVSDEKAEEAVSSGGKGTGKSMGKAKGKAKPKPKGKGKAKNGATDKRPRPEDDDSYYTSLRQTAPKSPGQGDWSSAEMRALDSNPFTSGPVLLCRLFVKELLDRCETPELCVEYREVALCLLQELAVVLPSPRFPCAGILLDMLRVRVSAVLTSEETGVTENRPSTDPQSQLLVFYMEVLSRMTTMQLCVQKVHMDQELLACRYGLHLGSGDGAGAGAGAGGVLKATDYNSNVVRALKDKVRNGQEAWLTLLRGKGDATTVSTEVEAVAMVMEGDDDACIAEAKEGTDKEGGRGATRSSRRTRGIAARQRSAAGVTAMEAEQEPAGAGAGSGGDTSIADATADAASSLRRKLKVLESLCSMAVDAVSEYLTPQQCTSTEYVDRHFALCAYPFALLSLVGASEEGGVGSELQQALQGVCTRDLHQHLVCEYTRKRMQATRASAAREAFQALGPAMGSISSSDSEGDCALSSYHMLLVLWQRDALVEEYHGADAITAGTEAVAFSATARPAGVVAECARAFLDDLRRKAGLAHGVTKSRFGADADVNTDSAGSGGYGDGNGSTVAASSPFGGEAAKTDTKDDARAVLERPSRQLHTLHSWIQARYNALTTQRFVAQQCRYLLELLLHLVGQPAGAVRAKSIKTFGRLFAVDPSVLLARHTIRSAVAERLRDVEIKVREEATKVLGQALKNAFSAPIKTEDAAPSSAPASASALDNPVAAPASSPPTSTEEAQGGMELCVDEYVDPLLECLQDRAPSVRKAAVHVLRDIMLHAPLHSRCPGVCLELALRAKQEEGTSLRDTIRGAFQQLWFTRSSKSRTMHYLPRCPANHDREGSGIGETGSQSGVEDDFPPAPSIADAMDVDNGGRAPPQLQKQELEQTPAEAKATFTHAENVAAQLVGVMALIHLLETPEGTQAGPPAPDAGLLSTRGTVQGSLGDLVRELTHGQFGAISESGEVSTGPEAEGGVRINKAALSAAKRQFEDVSAALVEFLVRLEERDMALLTRLRAREGGTIIGRSPVAMPGLSPDSPHKAGEFLESELLVATVSALQLLCHAMPALLTGTIATLLPYLQAHSQLSNAQQARVALMVMEMTTSVVASLAKSKGASSAGHAVASVYQAATTTGMGMGMDMSAAGPSMAANAVVTSLPGVSFPGLIKDLQNISFRAPAMTNVNSAIRCMATITSHVTEDATQYMTIGTKCFNAIVSVARSVRTNAGAGAGAGASAGLVSVSNQSVAQVQRALVVLGALCEHSRLCFPQLLKLALSPSALSGDALSAAATAASAGDEERLALIIRDLESSTARLPLREGSRAITPLTINGSCYRAAVFALSIDDVGVQTRAVQALCQSFIGCPRLAFAARDTGLFSSLLDTQQRPEIFVEKFLAGMNTVMMLDETRTNLAASEGQTQQPPDAATQGHKQQQQQQQQQRGSVASSVGKRSGMDVMALMMAEGEEDEDEDEDEGWSEVGQNVLSASTHDADTTAAGAVCVQHKTALLALLTHRDLWLRLAALRLVATLLRQGILCPLDAVANLVCMQADADATVRREALEVLVLGDRKHPTFLDNRVVAGLEMAFDAQVAQVRTARLAMADPHSPAELWEAAHSPISAADISPTYTVSSSPSHSAAGSDGASVMAEPGPAVVVQSLFGDLYKQCFQAGGKKRTDAFLTSVLRTIRRLTGEMKSLRTSLVADSRLACASVTQRTAEGKAARARLQPRAVDERLAQLSHASGTCQYLMSILAHLPYESLSEPLQVISWLRRHVPVDTALVADELMSAVSELTEPPFLDLAPVVAATVSPSSDSGGGAGANAGTGAGQDMVTPRAQPRSLQGRNATPASYLRFSTAQPPVTDENIAVPTSALASVARGAKKGAGKGAGKSGASSSSSRTARGGTARAAGGTKRGSGKPVPKQSKRRRTSRASARESEEEEEEDEEEEEEWEQQSLVSSMSSRSHTTSRARPVPLAASIAPQADPGPGMSLDEGLFLSWVDTYCQSQLKITPTTGLRAGGGGNGSGALMDPVSESAGAAERGSPAADDGSDSAGTGGGDCDVASTSGLAVAALVLMGGEEARIREALLLLRQWLMRLYRLPEEKCAQFESSTSATGRNKAVKDASNAINREGGSLLASGQRGSADDIEMHCFEAFLSGASSVPSFGYGSNIHIAVSPAGPSVVDADADADAGAGAGAGAGAAVTPFSSSASRSTSSSAAPLPHHSCIFSSLHTSPQSALEAVKTSLGSIEKMSAMATAQEVPASQTQQHRKRARR